ncbi:PrpF protein [Geopyxis carbonaria]|nr:PrpF protein [Geopyxis carbonaria]
MFRRHLTTPNPLPATFMRGGTSKGIFLNRAHLPANPADWPPILRGIMGSPDAHGRQLNGMGGGASSLSKICVVGRPPPGPQPGTEDSVDIEYTFVQIGVTDGVIDMSGNCGNLTTAIGVFALDEKICRIPSLEIKATMKLRNINTGKTIRTSFPVSPHTGLATLGDADIAIAGVPGKGSRIRLEFLHPAGASTGALLPTRAARDRIALGAHGECVKISCIDAANPTVCLTLSKLNRLLHARAIACLPAQPAEFLACSFAPAVMDILEDIRGRAAVLMGLDPAVQAQPKICVLRPTDAPDAPYDFAVKTVSMGTLHKAIPSTVALCLAAAVGVKGSVVNVAHAFVVKRRKTSGEPDDKRGPPPSVELKLGIPGGVVSVVGRFAHDGTVTSVAMDRTARRLMRGEVFW